MLYEEHDLREFILDYSVVLTLAIIKHCQSKVLWLWLSLAKL